MVPTKKSLMSSLREMNYSKKFQFVVVVHTNEGVKYLAGEDPQYLSGNLDNPDTGALVARLFKSTGEASRGAKLAKSLAASEGLEVKKCRIINLEQALKGVAESVKREGHEPQEPDNGIEDYQVTWSDSKGGLCTQEVSAPSEEIAIQRALGMNWKEEHPDARAILDSFQGVDRGSVAGKFKVRSRQID